MRLDFDQKMNLSNLLYKQEQEAAETARRLGLENEYVCHFAPPMFTSKSMFN
jgi:hypothetical protein